MDFKVTKRYVVGFVFDSSLLKVLFIKRNRPPYENFLNGIGGKIEEGETIHQSMRRELFEETDIKEEHIKKIDYLTTNYYPTGVELNVFYIILNDDYMKKKTIETPEGTLLWKDFVRDKLYDVTNIDYAGEGGIAYYLNFALMKEGLDTDLIKNMFV